ncbi:prepilin peptidase [Olsenella uli]|uniref:prepilin peptidase n=1 Tax=Olsenella uli TaxID=133926 RepID=UPI0019588BD5|nr:prepilin peptidase [Olsenella uli]MBM6675593.1 prepilin peptidase [Olsenella uli]
MVEFVVTTACAGVLAAALGVAAATDLSCRIVPNGCALAVALSGLVRALARILAGTGGAAPLLRAAGGGALVLLVMLAAAALSGRHGREPGVGGGDVKLLSAVGVWTGPVGGLLAVGLSCLVGVVGWAVSAPLRRRRRAATGAIPLAPAVAVVTMPLVLAGLPVAATL